MIAYSGPEGNHTLSAHAEYRLDSLEKDIVELTFRSMREALQPASIENQSEELLGLVKFKSKGLGVILENVGMLHNAISSNYSSIYSAFVAFPDGMRFSAPSAYLMAKFFSQDLLREFLELHPELSRPGSEADLQSSAVSFQCKIQPNFLPGR
jgi:hypothetical protein